MTPAPYRIDAMQGRMPFILMLWMALVVAVLSALAPLGPPSSRHTGSAFNPATTSVVLKARAPTEPFLLRTAEPDGTGKASPLASAMTWLLPTMVTLLGLTPIQAADLFSPSTDALLFTGLLSRRRARAPPAFS